MKFFNQRTLFCTGKQYAIYENKDQVAEKLNIGNIWKKEQINKYSKKSNK